MQQTCKRKSHTSCRKVQGVATSTNWNDAKDILSFSILGRTYKYPRKGLQVATIVYESMGHDIRTHDEAKAKWYHDNDQKSNAHPFEPIREWNYLMGGCSFDNTQTMTPDDRMELLTVEHLNTLSSSSGLILVHPVWCPLNLYPRAETRRRDASIRK